MFFLLVVPSHCIAIEDTSKYLQLKGPLLPVHRLDKFTTGCLILCRTKASAKAISLQLSQRSVGKTYLALVDTRNNAFQGKTSGRLLTGWAEEEGWPRICPLEDSGSKRAITDWTVLASSVRTCYSFTLSKYVSEVQGTKDRKNTLSVFLA